MINFVVLLLSFFIGLFCQNLKKFPKSTGSSLNLFVIYVSLPSLIFAKVPVLIDNLELTGHWWIPVAAMWFVFLLSWLLISNIAKLNSWSSKTTGALILTAGLGNTSFVGFPLLEALIGPEALSIGILADQPGSFLILSTLGIWIAARYGGETVSPLQIINRLITFPPFLAILGSLLWWALKTPGWSLLEPALNQLAATLVPIALFVVGFQTRFNIQLIAKRKRSLFIGLTLKLFFFPLVCWFLFLKVLGHNDLFTHVAILEAAMATQITSAIVAHDFELDSELANLMVSLSIPLSLASVTLWHFFL